MEIRPWMRNETTAPNGLCSALPAQTSCEPECGSCARREVRRSHTWRAGATPAGTLFLRRASDWPESLTRCTVFFVRAAPVLPVFPLRAIPLRPFASSSATRSSWPPRIKRPCQPYARRRRLPARVSYLLEFLVRRPVTHMCVRSTQPPSPSPASAGCPLRWASPPAFASCSAAQERVLVLAHFRPGRISWYLAPSACFSFPEPQA